MGLLHALHRNVKTIAMPLAMAVGAVLCRPLATLEAGAHGMITPTFIFIMLFVTFCRVEPRQMRFSRLHLWLLVCQFVGCAVAYLSLRWIDPVLAQGGLICVLAPVAMAAVVIGGMLGANVTTMASFNLISNLAVAVVAPVILAWVGAAHCTFGGILSRVGTLLVLPFVAAQLCRWLLPRVAQWVAGHGQISFYVWLLSLVFVIGRTTTFILDLESADPLSEVVFALVALVICLAQFRVGRALGARYGDPAAGGQSFGQKNTILAVWMAQSFLDPISSIAPTAYIIWQNLVNSYQLWRHDRIRG